MKLSDISHGPDWILWVVSGIFAIASALLISGHGSGLISGYNAASQEEKEKYNEKKLCRTMGIGMAVIAALTLFMGIFEDVLPASFAYVSLAVILTDVVTILVLSNTICKK